MQQTISLTIQSPPYLPHVPIRPNAKSDLKHGVKREVPEVFCQEDCVRILCIYLLPAQNLK